MQTFVKTARAIKRSTTCCYSVFSFENRPTILTHAVRLSWVENCGKYLKINPINHGFLRDYRPRLIFYPKFVRSFVTTLGLHAGILRRNPNSESLLTPLSIHATRVRIRPSSNFRQFFAKMDFCRPPPSVFPLPPCNQLKVSGGLLYKNCLMALQRIYINAQPTYNKETRFKHKF